MRTDLICSGRLREQTIRLSGLHLSFSRYTFLSDYLTDLTQHKINFFKNCPQWGLNSQPPDHQSHALPTGLGSNPTGGGAIFEEIYFVLCNFKSVRKSDRNASDCLIVKNPIAAENIALKKEEDRFELEFLKNLVYIEK